MSKLSPKERYAYFLDRINKEATREACTKRGGHQPAIRTLRKRPNTEREFSESMEEKFGMKETRNIPKPMYREPKEANYCSKHKTHSHSNEECRLNQSRRDMPGKREPQTKFPNKGRKTSDRAMIINEAQTQIRRISIEVEISKCKCQGILDTGAYRTLISRNLFLETGECPRNSISRRDAVYDRKWRPYDRKKAVDVTLTFNEFGNGGKIQDKMLHNGHVTRGSYHWP